MESYYIPLHVLKEITNGFSADSRIGRGGYGDVYKGVYNRREVAVKLLHVDTLLGLDDQRYINEVGNLLKVKHPNIIQLLGYCYEIQNELIEHNGANQFSQHIYRVLCFEYLQGGSLDKHLCAQSFAPNWSTRYNIIKGICEGLNFLHECKPQICHLDLKPANILLDSSMEPKVADFGLSRLFTPSHTHITERIIGTRKYMPPEFLNEGKISPKNDVFGFGVVMIEIMAGPAGYSNSFEMHDVAQLMQQVLTNCTMIEATSNNRSEELRQVKTCIELAMRCVDSERDNRPSVADILDTLNKTETHIPKRQHCPQISVPGLERAKKRKKTGGNLKGIAEERTHFTVMQENAPSMLENRDHRETSAKIGAEVVGRDMEKQEIMAHLSGSTTQEITFLPIYGIGGIGKTTMAQFVFNDSQFKEYSRVWTYVSQTFDLKKIGNSIITQLSGSKSMHTDLQMIENSLQKLLSGKRVLIILDDLWERESPQLKKLESMLNLGEGGKLVVVVTTREESIAHKIHTGRVKPYKLAPLTDEICWTIIKNKSSFENRAERAQLELIGKEIAKKCGGVALAAQSIGYVLYAMEFDEWVSVNNSEIWDVLASGESTHHVHASLLLSYHIMDKYLKLCFAYCATFPKGHKIAKEDLAHQWVALGLVEPSRTFSNIQTSHKYIRHLFGMCFLEHPRSQWSYMDVDNGFLIMHDLVHDLGRSFLADKIIIESPACQYAWLTDHRKLFKSSMNPLAKLFMSSMNPLAKLFKSSMTPLAKIRALHFLDRAYLQLNGEAFSPAKCLLVLDLSRCCAQKLPDSIGQLKQLRYLDASWNPEFTESSEYQAPPESLLIPKALGSLNELQYLNLSGRGRPIGLPEVISELTDLRYLNISHCMGYYLLDIPSANQSFIDCIGTLPNLEQLDMSSNNYGFCVPESFSRLKKLNLSDCQYIASLPENVGKVDIPMLFGLLFPQKGGFPVRVVDSESSSSLVWLKHTNPDVLGITDT
ncbi:unnamed protein product [Triticum turgidum subsp. durum]|uniref:non-specific serine/threonine protein kinase n=1 Tax=Triticum turgidum subsp. durum TaxID=4567 RepID=A0A9R1B7R6_TRITD|nr:unnamed protein product [Triticum turgidum subsp. durum]